ncbi:hypothetical protein SAMN05660690_3716 [Geodermatophilus telluris]|uniref:Uncharacterized protein n=1 Tax=Geodermatophilus telluris TaxID=1190417 RepID=A0A1G6T211_9ACTN|nr:hypothetical protein [Geodermatophilus telluris]SDD23059.1 hypothetical protein SAMN05660690_3716 [Geodermatophilus telluris]
MRTDTLETSLGQLPAREPVPGGGATAALLLRHTVASARGAS